MTIPTISIKPGGVPFDLNLTVMAPCEKLGSRIKCENSRSVARAFCPSTKS